MDKFCDYIDDLSRRYGRDKVFNDFLTIVVCCLSRGKQEEVYLKTIKQYKHEELDIFKEAFAALILEMDDNGKGLKDVSGDYFEKYFHNEKIGQFFTPPSLCKLMAELNPIDSDKMYDPCCGSGKIFLAVAEKNRKISFYGGDISETCCKMTLINLCLNGLKGEISWMNSLSMEIYKKWIVTFTTFPRIPYIMEIKEKQQNKEIEKVEEIQETRPIEEKDKKVLKFKHFSKTA